MNRITVAATALVLAGTLGACTYEDQRDLMTGAIAGGAVGAAREAITGNDDYASGVWQGAAIGAGAVLVRNVAEAAADRVFYPGGTQASQGYDDPYYSQGYGQPAYSQQRYGYPQSGYPQSGYGYPQAGYGYPDPYAGSRGYRY